MLHQTKKFTISALLAGVTIFGASGALLDSHATALAQASHPAGAAAKHRATHHVRKLAKLRRQVLTVNAITGTSIAATTRGGAAITVVTNGSTVFTEAGATVTISAVKPAEHIFVRGVVNRAAHTVQANRVTIVVPTLGGVVTNVSGTSITLTGRNAVPRVVNVAGAKIMQGGQSVTVQAIAVGSVLTVQGTTGTDGSFTVLRAVIRLPRLAGTISAVNGASFSLRTARGASYTVTTSATTTYVVRQRGAAAKTSRTAPAIAAGERALVEGTLSADGTTLAARRVVIAPARAQKQAATGTASATGA